MRLSSIMIALVGLVGVPACSLDKGTGDGPLPHPGDATIDVGEAGSDARRDSPGSDGAEGFDGPPPIEDTFVEDFGTPPPPNEHVGGIVGPGGGTIMGAVGTPLVHVSLEIPPGALAADTLIAIDLDHAPPSPPAGALMVTPYVRVGPDATVFAVPARLTLPYATTASTPLLVMLGRAGVTWSALLDPRGDPTAVTISAEMKRASPAAGWLVAMTTPPKPTSFSPDHAAIGDLVFVEGTSFGMAPAWHPAGDGGTELFSTVQIGGVTATPLAWSDTTISLRVPAGSTGGVITVNGPAGSGSTTTTLGVP